MIWNCFQGDVPGIGVKKSCPTPSASMHGWRFWNCVSWRNGPKGPLGVRNGEGGIRTHGSFHFAGFQDQSHQPLDHPSRGNNPIQAGHHSQKRVWHAIQPGAATKVLDKTRESGLHGGNGYTRCHGCSLHRFPCYSHQATGGNDPNPAGFSLP